MKLRPIILHCILHICIFLFCIHWDFENSSYYNLLYIMNVYEYCCYCHSYCIDFFI